MPASIIEQLNPIFNPRSVAILGASNNPMRWGSRTLRRALQSGYRGTIYPIHPKETEVQGLKSYPTVLDVPDDIDLAVIVIKAPLVPEAARQCIKKGVKGAVIITAGFAEVGQQGKKLQEEVAEICHEGGMRFVGPNCMGIWSSPLSLNLCFHGTPRSGSLAFVSQSGTLGDYLYEVAQSKRFGFSKFVSSGNQASLDVSDYLEYLGEDPDTKTIALYLEGVKNGRRLFDVARRVVQKKPVLVYKVGRTPEGARAALSHTASLAGDDVVFDTMCRQTGILRCHTIMELFHMAEALNNLPLPRGNRVAVVSGGGGFCVTVAEACASTGLQLPELDAEVQKKILDEMFDYAPPPRNPVDLIATKDRLSQAKVLEIVAGLDYIDGIITEPPWGNFGRRTPPEFMKQLIDVAARIADIPKKFGKPLIAIAFEGFDRVPTAEILKGAGIPFYDSPEACATAMYGLARYAENLRRVQTPY